MNFPLFETICLAQGELKNIELHQQRYVESLQQFYPNQQIQIYDLRELIEKSPEFSTALSQHKIRCRIAYNQQDYQLQFFPYQSKKYVKFQPVICDEINYELKYQDRTLLNSLLAQRGDADEIIIIKQGKVTDCSIGNLIFRRAQRWFTPDSPLLKGTQRAYLLQQGKIEACPIWAEDLPHFDEIRLINAMNSLD